jgi:3-hydroxyisobutyrate dehydrogenase-like beta-hydroxyacid dehydrogenase
MGTNVVHLGEAGLGHAAKLCNNVCLGASHALLFLRLAG